LRYRSVMGKYLTIQLPTSFVEKIIDPLIKDARFGFSSRADVVKEGVRRVYSELIGWDLDKNEKQIE
jgi:Arc/MetJ-type ribon-helix-helix transcriptional regulator